MQILEIIRSAFERSGERKNAALDCEVLLANVLGVEREYLIAHSEEEVDPDLVKLFEAYLARREKGEPIAYILKEKEFYGFDFYVDNRVLIPRPETELLVSLVLNYILKQQEEDKSRTFKLLDIGTGSGAIPIAILKTLENQENDCIKEFLALEVDEGAAEVARLNVEQNSLEPAIKILQSDLLEVVEEGESFDVIVTNLPYIATAKENKFIDHNVEKYEPSLALFAGEDGLDLYKKLFQQIKEKGIDYKLFIGEFGFGQSEKMRELLTQFFDQRFALEKDYAGIDRFFVVY
ncbi:MAG: peptide chain release factor N(5)-glutamine methyltransferase [Patescibacteria group bacterium]